MINKRIQAKILNKIYKIDRGLLFIVYFLTIISTLFIYSSTRSFYFVKQNILWILVGTLSMIFVMIIDYRITKSLIKYISIFTIGILLYTKFFGITKLGARRWISLAFIQIQPSEFVKIMLIMMLSYWILKIS